MKMKRELTKEDGIKIREYRKKIQDKRTDRRMLAVQQRSEGKRNKDIAEILGVDPRIVSQWVCYFRGLVLDCFGSTQFCYETAMFLCDECIKQKQEAHELLEKGRKYLTSLDS